MPSTTPVLALPYPVPADTVDVPRDVKALADKLDTISALRPPVVSVLPGAPVDGQEIYYLADPTGGVIWHLRYRSASASAYKWECIGGSPLVSEVATSQSTASTAYAELTTAGPAVGIPLAGDYLVTTEARISNATTGAYGYMSYSIGAATALDADSIAVRASATTAPDDNASRTKLKTALVAGAGLLAKYRVTAGSGTFEQRAMRALPVRVG